MNFKMDDRRVLCQHTRNHALVCLLFRKGIVTRVDLDEMVTISTETLLAVPGLSDEDRRYIVDEFSGWADAIESRKDAPTFTVIDGGKDD